MITRVEFSIYTFTKFRATDAYFNPKGWKKKCKKYQYETEKNKIG